MDFHGVHQVDAKLDVRFLNSLSGKRIHKYARSSVTVTLSRGPRLLHGQGNEYPIYIVKRTTLSLAKG